MITSTSPIVNRILIVIGRMCIYLKHLTWNKVPTYRLHVKNQRKSAFKERKSRENWKFQAAKREKKIFREKEKRDSRVRARAIQWSEKRRRGKIELIAAKTPQSCRVNVNHLKIKRVHLFVSARLNVHDCIGIRSQSRVKRGKVSEALKASVNSVKISLDTVFSVKKRKENHKLPPCVCQSEVH